MTATVSPQIASTGTLDDRASVLRCEVCATATAHDLLLSHRDNNNYVDRELYSVVRCRRCGLAEVEPKPPPEVLSRYYPQHYYSYDTTKNVFFRIKAQVARAARRLPAPLARRLLLDQLLLFAPVGPEPSVLDVGCGDGSSLRLLQMLGFKRLCGTELHGAAAPGGAGDIEIVGAPDLTTAPLRDGSFDVVRLSHVLEHVQNPAATLDRCHRLLKDDGRLLVAVPNFGCPANRLFGRYFCALQLPTHLYHFDRNNLVRILEAHGFQIEALFTTGYSGFSASLATLARDRFGWKLPAQLVDVLVLLLAPLDLAFNLARRGYITTVAARKRR